MTYLENLSFFWILQRKISSAEGRGDLVSVMTISAAAVISAGVSFTVMMLSVVVASHVGVKIQTTAQKGVDRRIRISRNTAEQSDSRVL